MPCDWGLWPHRSPCSPSPATFTQDMAAQLAIPSRLRVKLPPSRLGGVSVFFGGWRDQIQGRACAATPAPARSPVRRTRTCRISG